MAVGKVRNNLDTSGDIVVKDSDTPLDSWLRDHDNPNSLINMVPQGLKAPIENIPDHLLEMDLSKLENKIKNHKDAVQLLRLRTGFWLEHHSAVRSGRLINMKNIWSGVCSESYFRRQVLKNPDHLMWLVTPPPNERISLEELNMLLINELRDAAELPNVKKNGEPDSKLIDVKRRMFVDIQDRLRGMPVQRSENINRNYETKGDGLGGPPSEEREVSEVKNLEEIEARIKKLEDGESGEQ